MLSCSFVLWVIDVVLSSRGRYYEYIVCMFLDLIIRWSFGGDDRRGGRTEGWWAAGGEHTEYVTDTLCHDRLLLVLILLLYV